MRGLPSPVVEAIDKLAHALQPRRILLFGSRSRGRGHPDSDWDLAVIVDSDLPWYERETLAYRALRGMGVTVAVDVVVMTPAELEHERGVPGSLAWELAREAVVVFDAEVAA